MAGDLSGILVVTVEQAVAAPLASRLLADAGARVIKVERPEGDFARYYDADLLGESIHFVWLNAGKESIALDLRKCDDRRLLFRILARADVFLHNLGPGVPERLGIAADTLCARFPRLIVCEISGYGRRGPYRGMKAYDLLVQAESGIAHVTGIGAEPTRVGVSIADIGGGLEAYAAILRALFARERSGGGRHIEVSLFHTMSEWMNVPYLTFRYGGREPPRLGLHHPTIAPYGAYRCGDGRRVLIAVQNEREWQRLCAEVLERPELAADPRFRTNPDRVRHRTALDREIGRVFARFDREALVARLEAARIAYGRLTSLAELGRHSETRHRPVLLPSGETAEILAGGARIDDGDSRPARVPARDEHGSAIREEFNEDGGLEGDS